MTIGTFYDGIATCDRMKASELRLILPIEIQGVTNEYTLLFKPREVESVEYELDAFTGTTKELNRTPCD